MDLETAIKHALDGEAILFLGAGFAVGGTKDTEKTKPMKTGAQLAHVLCDDMGIPHSDNLTITATRYLEDPVYKKGLKSLISLLKEEMTCIGTTGEQLSILNVPWKRIYTTNYDNIAELASKDLKLSRKTITITAERYKQSLILEQAILHINGYIETLNERTFVDEFKITDDNYNRDGLLKSPWANLFETDLEKEKAVIFVGYSLDYDQDIVKCIYNKNINGKCIFIDIDFNDGDKEFKLNKYGTLYKIGAKGLAEKIEEIRKVYTPHIRPQKLSGFTERVSSMYFSQDKYTVVDLVDLLIKGDLKIQYINQDGYCLRREKKLKETIEKLKSHSIVIIQSKLGNGKSVFLECLANELCMDHAVYMVDNLDNFLEDFQLIQSNQERTNILLIDDYGFYIQLLIELGRAFPENLKIVLTCRSSINYNLHYDLVEKYHYTEDMIDIVDLDELGEDEIYQLVKLLDKNRLWGIDDALSIGQKKNKIKKEYDAISKLFYILLNSEAIKKQIDDIMSSIFKKTDFKKFVIAQVINSLCRLKISYSDLCKFLEISETSLTHYRVDPTIAQVIDFSNNKFILTSSIFSQYIVRQSELRGCIINIMGQIYTACAENDEYINKYKNQRKILVSRSNIKLAFSTHHSNDLNEERQMLSYYDQIKNLPTATRNPFFWLQFGITALNLEEYVLAEIDFNNAYANAGLLEDFDSFQLDTHYARLLLCKEMKTNANCKEQALDIFEAANDKLTNNSNAGPKLSYVLKQAGHYWEFYNKYSPLFNDADRQKFLSTASCLIDKFDTFFSITNQSSIPIDVSRAYRDYRKIFINTPYKLRLIEIDKKFNQKVPHKKFIIK